MSFEFFCRADTSRKNSASTVLGRVLWDTFETCDRVETRKKVASGLFGKSLLFGKKKKLKS